jgi:Spy/CpxP family protein refolding chaperone
MNTVVRVFLLGLVVVSAAAAATAPAINSHQSVSASMPMPGCGPHVPTCPNNGN